MTYFGTNNVDLATLTTDTEAFVFDGNDQVTGDSDGEEIYLGIGNDLSMGGGLLTFSGTGSVSDPYKIQTFAANSGDDWIFGEDGSDMLYGADGNDILSGGEGDDSGSQVGYSPGVYYVAGLFGGNGDDTLYGDEGNDDLFGENGDDALYGGTENDMLDGGDGNDVMSGEDGNDMLKGGLLNDKVIGGNGNDRALGGDGNDILYGSSGSDSLYGEAGNDWLIGGAGVDFLNGGAGVDKFRFDARTECGDNIRNFAADDFIVLKGSQFGGLAAGALSAARFWSNTTGLAHDSSDRFIYNTTNDALYYDSNGNAAGGTKLMIADLSNDFTMTAADILIA